MFAKAEKKTSVSISLFDGSEIQGSIAVGASGDIATAVNAQTDFIEIFLNNGSRRFLSKRQITSIQPLDAVRQPRIASRLPIHDAYALLGIPANSDWEMARRAFREMAKIYHPDRYDALDLPPEMKKYAAEMFLQINRAMDLIRNDFDKDKDTARSLDTDPDLKRDRGPV